MKKNPGKCRRLQVAGCDELSKAMVLSEFGGRNRERHQIQMSNLTLVMHKAQAVRWNGT